MPKVATDKGPMSDFIVELLDLAELHATPEPEWLIEDFIHQQEVGVIYGPPNVGKSFVALDWALSVATGQPWLGRYSTKQAPVLYLAGEGAASLDKRVVAWQTFHTQPDAPIIFQTRPLPLREEDIIDAIKDALLTAYHDPETGYPGEIRPGLIIVDTLSQFMMGGDENGSDMALFVANLRRLSQEQNAAVLIVHHTNKGGFLPRGHSALEGNVDVMFFVSSKEENGEFQAIDVTTTKQRDSARAKPVSISVSRSSNSLVLSLAIPSAIPQTVTELSLESLRNLLVVADSVIDSGTQVFVSKEWQEVSGLLDRTYFRNVHKLKKLKLVKDAGHGKYQFTDKGRETMIYYREKA